MPSNAQYGLYRLYMTICGLIFWKQLLGYSPKVPSSSLFVLSSKWITWPWHHCCPCCPGKGRFVNGSMRVMCWLCLKGHCLDWVKKERLLMLGAPANCTVFDFVWLGSLVNHLIVDWWFGFGFLASPYEIGLLPRGTPRIPNHQPQPKQPICHALFFLLFSIGSFQFWKCFLQRWNWWNQKTPMVFHGISSCFFSRQVEEAWIVDVFFHGHFAWK